MPRGGRRSGAGRPKGSISASPLIRQALIDAIHELEAEGESLVQIIKRELQAQPLATLKALAAFEVREKVVDAQVDAVTLPQLLEQVEEEHKRRRLAVVDS